MASKEDYDGGMEEMEWLIAENVAGLSMPSSKPATYQFLSDPEIDVDEFAYALAEHDFTLHDLNYDTREDGAFYFYCTVITDHYKQISVRMWSLSQMVRIYPVEDGPDRYEFCRIVNAIEDAFGAELKHTPERERSFESSFKRAKEESQ